MFEEPFEKPKFFRLGLFLYHVHNDLVRWIRKCKGYQVWLCRYKETH